MNKTQLEYIASRFEELLSYAPNTRGLAWRQEANAFFTEDQRIYNDSEKLKKQVSNKLKEIKEFLK